MFSCVFPLLQFVSLCLSVFSPLCSPLHYRTWPPPSPLSSPVPRLIVSGCVLSFCFPSCLCLFIASVPDSVSVMPLVEVSCLASSRVSWHVLDFDFFDAFLIWTLLLVVLCFSFSFDLVLLFCCYFGFWSSNSFSFVVFGFCFAVSFFLNKSSHSVLPDPVSCLNLHLAPPFSFPPFIHSFIHSFIHFIYLFYFFIYLNLLWHRLKLAKAKPIQCIV